MNPKIKNLKICYFFSLCSFLWCGCHLGLPHLSSRPPSGLLSPTTASGWFLTCLVWWQLLLPRWRLDSGWDSHSALWGIFLCLCQWPQTTPSASLYSGGLFADCQGMAVYCMDLVFQFSTLKNSNTKIVLKVNNEPYECMNHKWN